MEWCGVLHTRRLERHLSHAATTSGRGSGTAKLNSTDLMHTGQQLLYDFV